MLSRRRRWLKKQPRQLQFPNFVGAVPFLSSHLERKTCPAAANGRHKKPQCFQNAKWLEKSWEAPPQRVVRKEPWRPPLRHQAHTAGLQKKPSSTCESFANLESKLEHEVLITAGPPRPSGALRLHTACLLCFFISRIIHELSRLNKTQSYCKSFACVKTRIRIGAFPVGIVGHLVSGSIRAGNRHYVCRKVVLCHCLQLFGKRNMPSV